MELFDPIYLDWNSDLKSFRNFDFFGPLRYNLEEVRDGHYRLAGYMGWYLYGLLVFSNFFYYADLHYNRYTMSNYTGGSMGISFRTFWGAGTWIRNVLKIGSWGITGLFWGLTFFPVDWPLIVFHYITVTLFVMEVVTLCAHFLNNIIAMVMDH